MSQIAKTTGKELPVSGNVPEKMRTRSSNNPKIIFPFSKTEWFKRNVALQGPSRSVKLTSGLKIVDTLNEVKEQINEYSGIRIMLRMSE